MLAAIMSVVPITDSDGLASASKSIMSALNGQKKDVKGDKYAKSFNESQALLAKGNDATNLTVPNDAEMKA